MTFEILGVRNRMVWPYLPTAHRRSTKLESICAEESISYTQCRATYTLSVSEKKVISKKRILHLFLKQ